VARLYNDDHENRLIDGARRRGGGDAVRTRGEHGAVAPRTVGLFTAGFVLGAVAIGSMGLAIAPVDPPAVRPVELRSPDQRDRAGDGADHRQDRAERRRGAARRARGERRGTAEPRSPQARQQQPRAQPAPPTTAPRRRTPAPRSTPSPRPKPQPAPATPPAPQPAPPPPADDDSGEADEPGENAGQVDDLDQD
jgi:hypothetical protein